MASSRRPAMAAAAMAVFAFRLGGAVRDASAKQGGDATPGKPCIVGTKTFRHGAKVRKCDGVGEVCEAAPKALGGGFVTLDPVRAAANAPDRTCYLESMLGSEEDQDVKVRLPIATGAASVTCTVGPWDDFSDPAWTCSRTGLTVVLPHPGSAIRDPEPCQIDDVTRFSGLKGSANLGAAVALCEAAGYPVQVLTDDSDVRVAMGRQIRGAHLGLLLRGWTWYMRRGFMPIYRTQIDDFAAASRRVLLGGKADALAKLIRPHLTRWCRGVIEARKLFPGLHGDPQHSGALAERLTIISENLLEPAATHSMPAMVAAVGFGGLLNVRVSALPQTVEVLLREAGCELVE